MTPPLTGKLFVGSRGEPCRVELRAGTLVVTTSSRTVELPLVAGALSFGGTNEAKLVVTHEQGGERSVLYLPRDEAEPALRADGRREITEWLDGESRARAVRRSRRGGIAAAIVALCVALALLANAVVDAAIAWGVERVPESLEVELGRELAGASFPPSVRGEDPVVGAAVEAIATRLFEHAEAGEYELEVRIVDEPGVNAFALPGGQMVLLVGLIELAESPEEVAGVLAHEIQHVLHRHSLRGLLERMKWSLAVSLLVGDVDSVAELLLASGADSMVLSHGRDAEREADVEGFELLVRAGIDPRGMIRFFERLDESGGGALPAFLSTHPGGEERVGYLRERLAELGERSFEPMPIDWAAVKVRLEEGDGASRDPGEP